MIVTILHDVQTVNRVGWVHLVVIIVLTANKFQWTVVIVNVIHAIQEVAVTWNVQIMENVTELNVSVTRLKGGVVHFVKYQDVQALEKIVLVMETVTV